MTRSAGTSGLTSAGSPPRSAIASRMTARSTTAGTPVKSWSRTRAGMNGISASAAAPGRQARSVSTSSARTTAAAGVAEQVLEQDLDRHRQRREIDPVADGVEPVVAVVDLADAQARARVEWIGDG